MPGGFNQNTSLIIQELPALTRPTGGGLVSADLPKTGLLSHLFLRITATVTGTLSAPNALGASSIIRSVRLATNSAIDLFQISGAGYAYLLDEVLESEYFRSQGQNEGRSAVTATTFNLDMVIPISMNLRDPIGLFMLQNEQTLVTLSVDFEADATVATGATVTATVTPYMHFFTIPVSREDWPRLDVLHQIVETQEQIAGAGDFAYNAPRGNTYLQILHGAGIGASGSDNFTRFRRRVNQSTFLTDIDPDYMDMEHRYLRGRARPAGGIYVDLMGRSGLGNYGLTRDFFNSGEVTDYAHVIAASGAGTLFTVRRQLVALT